MGITFKTYLTRKGNVKCSKREPRSAACGGRSERRGAKTTSSASGANNAPIVFVLCEALTGLESGDDVVVSISPVEADDEEEFDEYEDTVETVDEGIIVPFDFLREAGFDFTKPLSISVCEGMINIEEVDEEEEDYDYE